MPAMATAAHPGKVRKQQERRPQGPHTSKSTSSLMLLLKPGSSEHREHGGGKPGECPGEMGLRQGLTVPGRVTTVRMENAFLGAQGRAWQNERGFAQQTPLSVGESAEFCLGLGKCLLCNGN